MTDEAENDRRRQAAAATDNSGDAGKSDSPDQENQEDHKPRSKLPIIIAAAVVAAVIVLGVIYWLMTQGEVTTDDAYTDGRTISIASNVSGYVTKLYINDNEYVHKGELLLVVDPRQNEARLKQAQANLQLAEANLDAARIQLQQEQVRAPAQQLQAEGKLLQAKAEYADAESNYKRLTSVSRQATSQTNIDRARQKMLSAKAQVQVAEANLAVASLVQQNIATAKQAVVQRKAQVAQAKAGVNSAQTALSYNHIRAPQDGWITMRTVDLGTYVQAGSQVFEIVGTHGWITANFKETQLSGIKPGQKVTISVDAYPSLHLKGEVNSIQKGSGAVFSAFPAENATGNFVKIVRRVPVKILITSGLPKSMPVLPLGLSVEPTVYEK